MDLKSQLDALDEDKNLTVLQKQSAEPNHPLIDYLKQGGGIDAIKRQAASERDIAPIIAQTQSAIDYHEDEADEWEKEVRYRQDLLDSPAISGLSPEILKSNLDYAKRKQAEALAARERAQALKTENLSDLGMAFAQNFAPQAVEAKAIEQYAVSAGAPRTARAAAGIAEYLNLTTQSSGWKPLSWSEVRGFKDFSRFLSQEIGSVAGMLAHFATIGAATGGAGVISDMVAMGHGQMRMALEEKGITDEATLAKGAYTYGTLIGGLQTIVPWAAMRNLSPAASRAFVHSIADIAARTAEHSITMGSAQVLAMSLAGVAETYGVTDAEGKPIDWDEVAKRIIDEAPRNMISGMLFGVAGESMKAAGGGYKFAPRPQARPGSEPAVSPGASSPETPGSGGFAGAPGEAVKVAGGGYRFAPRPRAEPSKPSVPAEAMETGEKTGQPEPTPVPQVPENVGEVTTQDLARELAVLQTERTPEAEARKAEIEQQMATPAEVATAASPEGVAPAEQPAKLTVPGVPNEDYFSKLASGEEAIPSTEELRGLRDKARGADEQYWQMLGAPPGTAARVRQLNRIADTAGGERADQAIAELNKLADQYAKEGTPEPGYVDEERLTHLVNEMDALDRRPDESAADYLDGASRVLRRYLFDFINGDEMAAVIWRKAFDEAQKTGISTKELSDFAISRVMNDLPAHDRAFVGDMIRKFTGREPAEAVKAIASSAEAAIAPPQTVRSELARLAEDARPAVPAKRSVFPDVIVSLIDGSKHEDLRPHLQEAGLTPEQYRAIFGLPDDYPLVAPNIEPSKFEPRTAKFTSPSQEEVKRIIGEARQPDAKPAVKSFDEMTDAELRLREIEALGNLAENRTQEQMLFQAAWGDVAQRFFQSLEYDLPSAGKRLTGEARESLDRLTQSMGDVVQAVRMADRDAAIAAMRVARDRASELLAKTDNAGTAKLFTQWVDSAWKKHVEPLLKMQEAAAKPATPISEAHRTRFRDILRGSSARKQWAELMGVDPQTLGALIADAESRGLLRVDPRGVVRRTAKARTGELAPTEPTTTRSFADHVKTIATEVQPGERMPVADAYERMRAEGYDGTLDEFKAALAREARAGKIELARHDIAMPEDAAAAEKLQQSRMPFGRDERHYIVREDGRPERVPTFEEVRQALPRDEVGDADMAALTALMRDRFGKASWAELTPDEKRAAFADFAPRAALRSPLPERISAEAVNELAQRAEDMTPKERAEALDWLEKQRQDDVKAGEELMRRCASPKK